MGSKETKYNRPAPLSKNQRILVVFIMDTLTKNWGWFNEVQSCKI